MFNRIGKVSAFQFYQLYRFGILITTNILFAKGLLDMSEIGLYETLILIFSFFTLCWVTGSMQGLIISWNKISDNEKQKKQAVFFTGFLWLCSISLLICSILYLCREIIFSIFSLEFSVENEKTYLSYLPYLFLNTPAFLTEYIYLLKKKSGSLLRMGIITLTFQFIALLLPLYLGHELRTAFIFLIPAALIRWVFLIRALYLYSIIQFNLKEYLNIAKHSLPLVLMSLIGAYTSFIDGWMIQSVLGAAALAIFMYGAREFPLSTLLANSFSEALASRGNLSGDKEKMRDIKLLSTNLMHLIFPLSAILMLLSAYLFRLMYNAELSSGYAVFNLYLLLAIPRMLFPQTILLSEGRTKILFQTSVLETIVNVSFSLLLLHKLGIKGVALGTLIAFVFEKVVLIYRLWKECGIHPREYTNFNVLGGWSVVLVLCWVITILLSY
jgi:O-antigen/teichoic acid export membrane protein